MAAAPQTDLRGGVGYRQIATTLIQEIRGGQWRLDEPMPTEMQLVERFGVGRNTVREALRELEGLGYIERRRGARSTLRSVSPEGAFVNSVRSVEELVEYASSTSAALLATEVVRIDRAMADRLEIAPDTELLRIGILRSRDGGEDPFCYSEIYIDPKYRNVVEMMGGAVSQLFPLIEKHHRVVLRRVTQETEAAAADANIASRLNVEVGSPILLVRTKFFSTDGKLVETGLSHFPCGRYRVRIALDRKSVDIS